ncbi:MAG: PaaI family thioesterase [Deltaproteobacteria bacterium]|nr:PaaI family thioesterase [Deltaproteobacteria bacterium]
MNPVAKEQPAWLKEYLLSLSELSSYANYLRMEIIELRSGETTVSMLVRHELTNLSGILHGGAVGSLIDMAMNLACFSLGRRATVLGFNTNFLGGAREGDTVRAEARVLHSGRSTMVVEGRVMDSQGKLLAKARGTFLAQGEFTPQESAVRPSQRAAAATAEVKAAAPVRGADATGNPGAREEEAVDRVDPGLEAFLVGLHDRNLFAKYLGMEIADVHKGNSVVSMLITDKHTNIRGVSHGGALVSLADMAMMLACATLGRRTVTLDLNISFMRRVSEGCTIRAHCGVIHSGKTTMVVEGKITDGSRLLLAAARGTFFATGEYRP